MKPNIGLVNAMIRMTFGFTILAWVTAKMVKRPWRDSYFWVAMIAGMKVAEGITRFCPLTALFEKYQGSERCNSVSEKCDDNYNTDNNTNSTTNSNNNNDNNRNNNNEVDQNIIQQLAENLTKS